MLRRDCVSSLEVAREVWGERVGCYPDEQTNKPPKHYTKTGAITSAVLLRKRGNIPNGSVPP